VVRLKNQERNLQTKVVARYAKNAGLMMKRKNKENNNTKN
jgi:hypothetical protein